jgi:hypothetical protein
MSTREELEQLDTAALHDRAVERAERHLDVGFLWDLVRALPVAEEVAGDNEMARADVARPIALLNDWRRAGKGELGEALRPMYIDYLLDHPE